LWLKSRTFFLIHKSTHMLIMKDWRDLLISTLEFFFRPSILKINHWICSTHVWNLQIRWLIFFFFFDISTQEGRDEFELVTSALWGVVFSWLSYPLRTRSLIFKMGRWENTRKHFQDWNIIEVKKLNFQYNYSKLRNLKGNKIFQRKIRKKNEK
jgi:hypothetical protein